MGEGGDTLGKLNIGMSVLSRDWDGGKDLSL